MPSSDELIPVWKNLDDHRLQIAEIQKLQAVDNHRILVMEKNHTEMCRQLVLTEGKIMESMASMRDQQTKLISRLDKEDGARSVVKYFPTLLQTIILVSTIVVLIRSFKG